MVAVRRYSCREGIGPVPAEPYPCPPGHLVCRRKVHNRARDPGPQLVSFLRTIIALLLSACLLVSCHAAEPATSSTPKAKPKPARTVAGAKTVGTARSTAQPVAPKNPLHTEAEVSGFSSETSDQLYGRLNLTNTCAKHKWWIRTDCGFTRSRTYGKTKVYESQISGWDIDTAYRRNSKRAYSFVSLVAGLKQRTPHSSTYWDQSNFSMLSVGYGKTILPGLELETSLAQISREKGSNDDRIAPLYTVRMKTPINPSVTVDAYVHLVQPWSRDSLVDSRMNLTYKLTQSLSMRLTYVANNVLGTTLTKSEWDKSFRVSLVFAR